ncbi:uncharacterized protein V1516DRAFT_623059 [Lipomyces oligophaga]|uniref:uncharacterized protein n=1 Tax=Lipomyces oligophaga TaxID=45792 RepID=UPI0034CF8505
MNVQELENSPETMRIDENNLDEHIFELYAAHLPPLNSDLGMYSRSDKCVELSLELDGSKPKSNILLDLEIHQAIGMLKSSMASTTGAVLWKVSRLFAEWILIPGTFFYSVFRTPGLTVLELGAGVSGLLACALTIPLLKNGRGLYVATDQAHIVPLLRRNICHNLPEVARCISASQSSIATGQVRTEVAVLDWESDSDFQSMISDLEIRPEFDIIVACDTIYNDFLIDPFVLTLSSISSANTIVVIAMQLRSNQVLESFLSALLQAQFKIYSILQAALDIRMRNGFVVYCLAR